MRGGRFHAILSTMETTFCAPLHPRDEHGHFSEKSVMALSETERETLLDWLEAEPYADCNGIHVSARKLAAVLAGNYAHEIAACAILAAQGFEVYLLDETYVRGEKADIFFKKDGVRDFMELKHVEEKGKLAKQYARSVNQAPNCFLVAEGYVSKVQKENLKNAIAKNKYAKNVYVYLQADNAFFKIK